MANRDVLCRDGDYHHYADERAGVADIWCGEGLDGAPFADVWDCDGGREPESRDGEVAEGREFAHRNSWTAARSSAGV